MSCQRHERLCAAEHLIQSYPSLLVSQTPPLCSAASPPPPLGDSSCRTHENCMHAEHIIVIFYIFFSFYSMYLVLFSIVLHRTIVTVYTNSMFLHNYLWQMNQIIHLSPVGCFTPVRGKTVQKKKREEAGSSACHFTYSPKTQQELNFGKSLIISYRVNALQLNFLEILYHILSSHKSSQTNKCKIFAPYDTPQ